MATAPNDQAAGDLGAPTEERRHGRLSATGCSRCCGVATVVSNIGGWMYSAACGWLNDPSLNPAPLVVSLVQVANSLPMFLNRDPGGRAL